MNREKRLHVAVRLRDLQAERYANQFSRQADGSDCVSCVQFHEPSSEVRLFDPTLASRGFSRSFHVDSCMGASHSNAALFHRLCQPIIDSSINEPKHRASHDTLCFLAYGHTNSGKTHTIAGSSSGEAGLLTLCAEYLIERLGSVDVTMLELYSESVYDMLDCGQPRRIRRVASSPSQPVAIVVENITTKSAFTAAAWRRVAAEGLAIRRTASMELNERSSRSHAIFTLKAPNGLKLCLVDLAGSERQSIFSKQLNKESIAINKSLSRLSTVIQALGQPKKNMSGSKGVKYVNFRDTTLTVLLQRYLTSGTLTTFIACVHPNVAFMAETLSTLRYTTRLHRITLEPTALVTSSRQNSPEMQAGREIAERLAVELAVLRSQMAETSERSLRREEEHQRRINELELAHRTVLHELQSFSTSRSASVPSRTPHSAVDLTQLVDMTSLDVSRSESTLTSRAAYQRLHSDVAVMRVEKMHRARSQETKRIASWLLSRCVSRMPEFNVHFDDYFQDIFPLSVTSIGYVSCAACLLPRDPVDTTVRLGLLDAGDIVMALTMLDAGIPPFVSLHDAATCVSPLRWEACDLGLQSAPTMNHLPVYILAMFDVPASEIDSLCVDEVQSVDTSSGASTPVGGVSPSDADEAPCCSKFSSMEALMPFAIVFAVDATAPIEHHQAVYEHIALLKQQQDAVTNDIGRAVQLVEDSAAGRERRAISEADCEKIDLDVPSERVDVAPFRTTPSSFLAPACGNSSESNDVAPSKPERGQNEPLADWCAGVSPDRNDPSLQQNSPFRQLDPSSSSSSDCSDDIEWHEDKSEGCDAVSRREQPDMGSRWIMPKANTSDTDTDAGDDETPSLTRPLACQESFVPPASTQCPADITQVSAMTDDMSRAVTPTAALVDTNVVSLSTKPVLAEAQWMTHIREVDDGNYVEVGSNETPLARSATAIPRDPSPLAPSNVSHLDSSLVFRSSHRQSGVSVSPKKRRSDSEMLDGVPSSRVDTEPSASPLPVLCIAAEPIVISKSESRSISWKDASSVGGSRATSATSSVSLESDATGSKPLQQANHPEKPQARWAVLKPEKTARDSFHEGQAQPLVSGSAQPDIRAQVTAGHLAKKKKAKYHPDSDGAVCQVCALM